jgi:signal transduction histidine kinase/ActR/RegA family two-component response regulator
VFTHGVCFFEEGEFPSERIALFLSEGSSSGRFTLALATAEHLTALCGALTEQGADVAALKQSGQLVLHDAEQIAAALVRDGNVQRSVFEGLIAEEVRQGVQRWGSARAYGEVVDVLVRGGDPASALALEGFWGELLGESRAELLCGYALEPFSSEAMSQTFRHVCDHHGHVEAGKPRQLDKARLEAELVQSHAALTREAAQRRSVERDLHHAYDDLQRAYAVTRAACQRAERESTAKDEFIAMLDHELRNPLSPILVATELMARRQPDMLSAERKVIERQARHLTKLIGDLLDVARISAGRMELARKPVELAQVVSDALEVVAPHIAQRNQRLTVDVRNHGLIVNADRTRLTQILARLLSNAAEFTQPGGEIQVVAAERGEQIELSVIDNGAGIEPELLPRVFDHFMQARQTGNRRPPGLGLGLSIAHHLAELHGGRLRAFSEGPGRGSRFSLELPCVKARARSEVVQSGKYRALQGPLDVLVIDDNGDLAMLFAESLRAGGHRVEMALDGSSALALAAQRAPNVALLDLGLPDMDGCELAERLRALVGERELKLVAISGYGQEADRQRTQRAGFDLHLVKPVMIEELEGVLAALFVEQCVA